MRSFYQDTEKRFMVPELFSKEARDVAKRIRSRGRLQSSQFRNYFQQLRALESRYLADQQESQETAWHRLQPQLHLFKAKLAYGARKEGPLAQATEFRDFMEETIDSIKDGKDFEAAMLFVEAVLAYYYALETEQAKNNQRNRQHGRNRR